MKKKGYKPLSEAAISRILADNPKQEKPPDEKLSEGRPQAVRLRRIAEYDTLHPEDALRQFLRFVREAQARYKEDVRLVAEYQLQKQDLDHYAEMADNLDRTAACAYYRKMRDLGRARRACKNEATLLEPLIAFLDKNPEFIKRLEQVQGDLKAKRVHIDSLDYTAKTDILNK